MYLIITVKINKPYWLLKIHQLAMIKEIKRMNQIRLKPRLY